MTRHEAIEKLEQLRDEVYNEDSDGYNYAKAIDMAIEALEGKHGKWIAIEDYESLDVIGYYCSECDLPMETEDKTNYCPNCGADMRERRDE